MPSVTAGNNIDVHYGWSGSERIEVLLRGGDAVRWYSQITAIVSQKKRDTKEIVALSSPHCNPFSNKSAVDHEFKEHFLAYAMSK